MNDRETAQLLTGMGLDVTRPTVAALTLATEGWPVGVYLAALSWREGARRLSRGGEVLRRRPLHDGVLLVGVPLTAVAGGCAVPRGDRGPGSDVGAAVRCGPRTGGVGRGPSIARVGESASRPPGSASGVVPVSRIVPRSAPEPVAAIVTPISCVEVRRRASDWCRAQRPPRGVGRLRARRRRCRPSREATHRHRLADVGRRSRGHGRAMVRLARCPRAVRIPTHRPRSSGRGSGR